MTRLLLVPLDDAVVFPGMSLTLAVDVGEEERVLLVPRHGQEFASVGTVAEVSERVRLPGGARAVTLQGLHRGVAGAAHTMPDGRLFVQGARRPVAPADAAGRAAFARGRGAAGPRARRRAHAEPRARGPRRGRGDPRVPRRRRPD